MSSINDTMPALGKVLCKGSGLKAYLEITLNKGNYGDITYKKFRYEIGALQSITSQANRQVSHNYTAGRSKPVGTNKGLRNVYGNIVFQQLDAGILHDMFLDIKKWNAEQTALEEASLEGFTFDDFTIAETEAALLGTAKEDLEVKLNRTEPVSILDLPPVDIIVLGSADDIDPDSGIYEVNKTYKFEANGVVFLSETFGLTAGAPLHNVATQVLILKGIKPWEESGV
ncbi:MAG: hypothetical protein ACRC0G_03155 [Fusobacteriaceae bacterium]